MNDFQDYHLKPFSQELSEHFDIIIEQRNLSKIRGSDQVAKLWDYHDEETIDWS